MIKSLKRIKREFSLNFSGPFLKKAKKLTRKNPDLKRELNKVVSILKVNLFFPSLRTHKVESKFGPVRSSRVTKDIRIIWNFNGEIATVLDILGSGGHSVSKKVYK